MAIDIARIVENVMSTVEGAVLNGVRPIVYKHVTGSAYNPATGATTLTTETYNTKGTLTRFRDREIDGARIQVSDQRVLIAYNDLLIEPNMTDWLEINGVRWNITTARLDPTGSLHTLQVRKP